MQSSNTSRAEPCVIDLSEKRMRQERTYNKCKTRCFFSSLHVLFQPNGLVLFECLNLGIRLLPSQFKHEPFLIFPCFYKRFAPSSRSRCRSIASFSFPIPFAPTSLSMFSVYIFPDTRLDSAASS